MIALIAPYAKMKELADSVLHRYSIPVRTVVGDLGEAMESARQAAAEGSIIVSRGGTAKLIRDTLGVDVIEIGISQYELLRILKPYIGERKRVAVVGFRSLTEPAEKLCNILGIPVSALPVDHESEIGARMKALEDLEIDCLIGDMVAIRSAKGIRADLHLIESDTDAIIEALDKAAVVARSIWLQRESDLRIRAVFNTVQEGIISVDKSGIIDQINAKAGEMLRSPTLRSKSMNTIIPDLDLPSIVRESRDSFGKVVEANGHRAVANITPIILHGNPEGAVIVLQEVGKIQDLEKKVRKQLFAKGLVARHHFEDVVTDSRAMKECLAIARQYAMTTSNIVIYGETGTGKELIAQSIHNESPAREGPFVAINCGALPPTLLESELFGYVEGAFTGASKGGKAGLFELAHGGTIFLDEINELDFQLQSKLLRVLQEREVMRVGDTKIIPVTVRVIAASNVPLRDEVEKGRIRKDLFYRLNVLDIRIPPLRERREDVLSLFFHFAHEYAARTRVKAGEAIPEELSAHLCQYYWPGNVRELENVAEKYVVLRRLFDERQSAAIVVGALDAPVNGQAPSGFSAGTVSGTLGEIESRIVREVFEREGRNVSRAAKRLGIDRQTLRKKLGDVANNLSDT